VKTAVRAISDGMRKEAGPNLRVSVISPGFVATEFVQAVSDAEVREQLLRQRDAMAVPSDGLDGFIWDVYCEGFYGREGSPTLQHGNFYIIGKIYMKPCGG
jgi:NAD(P)-dependent dehydrogenase (short-subunit alcohol dehydrogenase family)